MTSTELKHQAKLEDWALEVQDCRSSGLPVSAWCKQRGIHKTTYYRWEREVLAYTGNSRESPSKAQIVFTELALPAEPSRKLPERSATLHIGGGSIDLYQELSPALLNTLLQALKSC